MKCGRRGARVAAMVVALCASTWAGGARAYQFETDPDWKVSLDNTLQYTTGWRVQGLNPDIGNHLFFTQGDYKFPSAGDLVTNRVQDLLEFDAAYKNVGFRTSGSLWKDFAYDDAAKTNPNNPAFAALNAYPSGHYSEYTKRWFERGGELLDCFVFGNTDVGDTRLYAKAGRLTQYWGNAFFFAFSNIAYSQHPIDFIKAFSQPGSEVKELFLPRAQVLLTSELSPQLSVSGQYFFEYQPNLYPEGGTYLGFFDILFNGPPGGGALAPFGITRNDGLRQPSNTDANFGLKMTWSPNWAGGDMGFYYRQFDEVDPWLALVNPVDGHLQDTFAKKAKLIGLSYERAFGNISTGFELNQRRNSALNSAALVATNEGAKGTLTNVIANTLIQLGTTPVWDTGVLLAEMSFTHLDKVTGNNNLFKGVGTPNCADSVTGVAGAGTWRDGCATNDAIAVAMLFDPQWPQKFAGFDLEMPMSLTWGLKGNPAYRAGTFYAQDSKIYSIGVKATYHTKHTISLQYNGYFYRPSSTADNGLRAGLPAYAGFGGDGAVALNDRGWIELQLKTSF